MTKERFAGWILWNNDSSGPILSIPPGGVLPDGLVAGGFEVKQFDGRLWWRPLPPDEPEKP